MILDSNLIIYAAKPEYPGLRRWIAANVPAVSAISKVEVLGYHKLSDDDRTHFEQFFAAAQVLPVSEAVVDRAISPRQGLKLSLDDALIAATTLIAQTELYTHNVQDFRGIPELVVVDPIAAGDPA